jgi:hypothetical protein
LLALSDKIVQINVFGRRFSVEYPARTGWLIQDTDIIPHNRVIFITNGSLYDGMAGAGVFPKTLKLYALGKNTSAFQTEVYAVLSCSDYCRRMKLQDVTKCIYLDSCEFFKK